MGFWPRILEGNPLRFEAEAAAARPKTKNKGGLWGQFAMVLVEIAI